MNLLGPPGPIQNQLEGGWGSVSPAGARARYGCRARCALGAVPAQQLVGFARLDLETGASKTVTFVVPRSLLGYTGFSGDFSIEPGPIEFWADSSSSDVRSSAKLDVTGKTRVIEGDERAFLSVAQVSS